MSEIFDNRLNSRIQEKECYVTDMFFLDADKYIPSGRLDGRANFLVQRSALSKLGGIDPRPCLIRCNLTHIGWRIKVGRRQ